VPRVLAPSFTGFSHTSVHPDLLAALTVWAVLDAWHTHRTQPSTRSG